MVVLRRNRTGPWRDPASSAYTNEAELQRILAESPGLLYGVDAESAVVACELIIPGVGRPDLTIVDAAGSITLVECKLQTNPEIRRTIVGQILAYAAALAGSSVAQFTSAWRAATGSDLLASVSARLAQDLADSATDGFMAALEANLSAGRFRLILAVDQATDELRSVVEYLNRNSRDDLEIVCVAFEYIADEGIELLIPQTYGAESARQVSSRGAQHDEGSFRAALVQRCTPTLQRAAETLLDHARTHPAFDSFFWGVGADPSVTPCFRLSPGPVQPWTIYLTGSTPVGFAINFDWIHKRGAVASAASMERLAGALSALPGVEARVDQARAAEWRRRPTIPAEPLFEAPDAVQVVVAALNDMLG